MINFLKKELGAIYLFLKNSRNEAVVLSAASLFLTLYKYRLIGERWLTELVYFALLPLAVILLLRKNVLDFGLRAGEVRKWWGYVAITCLLAAPVLYIASRSPAFRSYYNIQQFDLANYFLVSLISLAATEFFYRGFLLFGLKDRFGEGSILVQMIPFVMVHFGKPEVETLSTIVTGVYFGWVAYRTKSYWPAFLIHLFINIFFVAVINFR